MPSSAPWSRSFLGVAVQGEQMDASSAVGMVLMLAAAGVVLLRG